jgi:hypothetical protein
MRASIARRSASARPSVLSRVVAPTEEAMSFTVTAESTDQCETSSARAPAKKKARARPDSAADRLGGLPASRVRFDAGVWDWISLFYIDVLAPLRANGTRDMKQNYRYTLELKNRMWSRHIARMSWMAVVDHGKFARIVLALPITKQSEVLEQLAGQQEVFGARSVIEAADKLYWDENTGSLKRGAQGKAAGTPRRLVRFMRQLRRTYDTPAMTAEQLVGTLPSEFDRWKQRERAQTAADRVYRSLAPRDRNVGRRIDRADLVPNNCDVLEGQRKPSARIQRVHKLIRGVEVAAALIDLAHGDNQPVHIVHHTGLKQVFQELVVRDAAPGFHLQHHRNAFSTRPFKP